MQHNILFYALSRYSNSDKIKYINELCDILSKKETLNLNLNEINSLKETIRSKAKLIEEDSEDKISFLLKKGDLTIILYQEAKTDKNKSDIEKKIIIYRSIQSLTN